MRQLDANAGGDEMPLGGEDLLKRTELASLEVKCVTCPGKRQLDAYGAMASLLTRSKLALSKTRYV